MKSKIILAFVAGIIVTIGLIAAIPGIDTPVSQAKKAESKPVEWSPTRPFPQHDVYYPGTEALASDEMRVIACGTGMPQPRLKQAAACFLVELGNGDKFIFDMGEGSVRQNIDPFQDHLLDHELRWCRAHAEYRDRRCRTVAAPEPTRWCRSRSHREATARTGR